MIKGFNHSGFVVRDLEKMVSFYRDDLGLEIEKKLIVKLRNLEIIQAYLVHTEL